MNMPESDLDQVNSYDRKLLLDVKQVLNAQMKDPDAGKGTVAGEFIELNRRLTDIIEENVGKLKDFIRKVSKEPNRDFEEVAWPSLYEGRNSSNPSSCHAFLPGVVNLTVLRRHLLVPACHIPSFDKIIEARFRAQGNQVHFIDDQAYHNSMGEIHCGTNVLREVNKTVITKEQVRAVQRVKQQFDLLHGL